MNPLTLALIQPAMLSLAGSLAFFPWSPSVLAKGSPPAETAVSAESNEAEFELARGQIADLVRGRRWRDVEDLVLKTLQQHLGREYVRPFLAGLREDLQRAEFWKDAREPNPKDLIKGKLLAYDRASGAIRVEYTRAGLADFEYDESTYTHPMNFTGSWSVEVEATSAELDSVVFAFGAGVLENHVVSFRHVLEGRNCTSIWPWVAYLA